MYKGLVRPHLDYGHITFDQAYNKKFYQILESIKYNACIALQELLEDHEEKNFTMT